MRSLALLLLATVAAGILAAVLIFVILFRAVSNVFDWIVLTFGNEGPV